MTTTRYDAVDLAEQSLASWARFNQERMQRRDDLVRMAHKVGVTKNRIHTITGIARTTIDRILAAT